MSEHVEWFKEVIASGLKEELGLVEGEDYHIDSRNPQVLFVNMREHDNCSYIIHIEKVDYSHPIDQEGMTQ